MNGTLRAQGGMPDGVWSYDLDTRQVEKIADSFDSFLRILIDSAV